MLYFVMSIFIIISFIQAWFLIKERLYKELAVSLALIAIAVLYSLNHMLHLNIPAPDEVVTWVFNPLSEYIFGEKY